MHVGVNKVNWTEALKTTVYVCDMYMPSYKNHWDQIQLCSLKLEQLKKPTWFDIGKFTGRALISLVIIRSVSTDILVV